MKLAAADALVNLAAPGPVDVRIATLVLLLVVAAAIDVRTLRIPNWLTLTGAAIGLALSVVGEARPLDSLLLAVGGMAAGLALLLPFWLMRVMGAGDVKLMAMAGAFVGSSHIVPVVLCVFVAGGLLALGWALYRRVFRRTAVNTAEIVMGLAVAAVNGVRPALTPVSAGKLPYGVSIAVGTLAWLLLSSLPH